MIEAWRKTSQYLLPVEKPEPGPTGGLDVSQLVISCGEMPLMQFGAINTGRYQAGAMPQSTHLYSWPMNNYRVTNFNADQRGGHSWTY